MSGSIIREQFVGAGANVTNTVGVRGPRGFSTLSGSGAPANTLGSDGDFYLDIVAGRRLYGPKAGGVWPTPGYNLKGEPGLDGVTSVEGGITPLQHSRLRQLQHYADGPFDFDCYLVVSSGLFPARSAWYRSSDDALVYESLVTYAGALVATETQKLFDVDGVTLLISVLDEYEYSGVNLTGIDRTIT